MFRHYRERVKAFFWGLVYEYRCAADWGVDTGRIITMRINKWTNDSTIIDERVVGRVTPPYQAA